MNMRHATIKANLNTVIFDNGSALAWSYETLIAVRLPGLGEAWRVTTRRYSTTTSQHKTLLEPSGDEHESRRLAHSEMQEIAAEILRRASATMQQGEVYST